MELYVYVRCSGIQLRMYRSMHTFPYLEVHGFLYRCRDKVQFGTIGHVRVRACVRACTCVCTCVRVWCTILTWHHAVYSTPQYTPQYHGHVYIALGLTPWHLVLALASPPCLRTFFLPLELHYQVIESQVEYIIYVYIWYTTTSLGCKTFMDTLNHVSFEWTLSLHIPSKYCGDMAVRAM